MGSMCSGLPNPNELSSVDCGRQPSLMASAGNNSDLDWRGLSLDPNAAETAAVRQQILEEARGGELIRDRVSHVCSLARGKSVLDVGCVEHSMAATTGADWLHGQLARTADRCVGVDILEDEIQQLIAAGYEVQCHDLLVSPLPETFDLVVCGELIEHLGSPLRLFESVAEMLNPGGLAVLTTPNPWYANVILKNILGRSVFVDSADHVAWYEPAVLLELARRAGLRLSFFAGVQVASPPSLLSRAFFLLGPILRALGVRREAFAKTIIYHFSKRAEESQEKVSSRSIES